jgi:hypothetical protein
MKYIGITIFCFIGMSCSYNIEREYFKEFPNTVNLSHERIETPPNLYAVGGMLLLDKVLITIDIKADIFFQAVHLPEYDYIGGYIAKGSGPNEEIFIYPYIKTLSQNSFYYKSLTAVKMMTFDVETNLLKLTSQINLPDMQISSNKNLLNQMWQVFKINDSIIGSVNNSKKEYIGIDTNTTEIFDFGGDYPNIGKKIDNVYKSMLFAKATIVKRDGSAFAAVYDKFPILRIFSRNGIPIKEIWYENNQTFPDALINNEPSQYSINEIMQNYRIIQSSNKYIYALYIGKKLGELGIGLDDFSNEIHVWDWNGTPIANELLRNKLTIIFYNTLNYNT